MKHNMNNNMKINKITFNKMKNDTGKRPFVYLIQLGHSGPYLWLILVWPSFENISGQT